MDTPTISSGGDPFYAVAQHDDECLHACMGGLVFIGHLVEGGDGEEVEVFEAVPCRRCAEKVTAVAYDG